MIYLKTLLGAALLTGSTLFTAHALADAFPLKSDDLNLNHRYFTVDHGPGAGQAFGRDIAAVRPVGNQWTPLVSNDADDKSNGNHLIYGRKVYAMVSGTVVNCWRNAPENPRANQMHPDVDNGKMGVGGNQVTIRTADGVYAMHAHMIPGSISAAICPHQKTRFDGTSGGLVFPVESQVSGGVTITKGQYLGLAGNSGNSSGPHLHVHMAIGKTPIQMKFEHGQTQPLTNGTASPSGPWTLLKGNQLPTGPILIWAPRSTAYWTINNVTSAGFQGWFNHMTDSGQMPENLSCHGGGDFYNTDWVPSKGSWVARAGMSAIDLAVQTSTLATQGYSQYKWWYCDSVRSAIWRK